MGDEKTEIGADKSAGTVGTPPAELAGAAARRKTPVDDDVDADLPEATMARDTDADSSEASNTDTLAQRLKDEHRAAGGSIVWDFAFLVAACAPPVLR